MRTNLEVPYPEKDEAKRLGARWDWELRVWYILDLDPKPFMRWMPKHLKPTGGETARREERPPKEKSQREVRASRKKASKAALRNGRPRWTHTTNEIKPCACLPWVGCEKCCPDQNSSQADS